MIFRVCFIIIIFVNFLVGMSEEQIKKHELPTDLLDIESFNEQDPRLDHFGRMCLDLGQIVQEKFHYFLSYAWPNEQSESGRRLRCWIDQFYKHLKLASFDITYDTKDFTGRVRDLGNRLKERDVIVLLTPDYHFKCELGELSSLSKEGQLVFSKDDCQRKFVLLAGRDSDSFPTRFGGYYTLGSEMLNMMTMSSYFQQTSHDIPKMDAFFSVMCNLFDPDNLWGLLYHLSAEKKAQCLPILNSFKDSYRSIQACQTLSHPKNIKLNTSKKVININQNLSEIRLNNYYFEERYTNSGLSYLEQIKVFFKEKKEEDGDYNIINLSGIGGIGKTTLARKYALKNMRDYHVVWLLPCEKTDAFHLSIKDLYKSLYGNQALLSNMTDIISAIKKKLEEGCAKCLFLYDNVQDEHLVDNDFLFQGDTLITSRKIIERNFIQFFPLILFTQEESIHCLKECSLRKFDDENPKILEEIIIFLGNLPLAISQAGYYLKTQKRETAKKYLKKLNEKPLVSLKLETLEFPFSVYKTFEISYKSLSKEESRIILFVSGFLNPDNIPLSILDCLDIKNTSDLISLSALDELEQYGFFKYTGEGLFSYASIHRLYQAIVRFAAKEAKSADDIFGQYTFSNIYLKVIELWQEWIKNYEAPDAKQATYYYLTYFLQNWKTLNQHAIDYSIPTIDYQFLKDLKISLLKDFLRITMNDELIFDELEVEKEDRVHIREKLKDFLSFLQDKKSSIDIVSLHQWLKNNPTLSIPHLNFLRELMINIDKFDFEELDLKKFLEWISFVDVEDLDVLYGRLLETMDGHFDYPGFALGVTGLIPEEDWKYFYEHFLSFTKEDPSITEDDYECIVDCSRNNKIYTYLKYYLKIYDYNSLSFNCSFREMRIKPYQYEDADEELEIFNRGYKIISDIFDEEFDKKYKNYRKMGLILTYMANIWGKSNEEDKEKNVRLVVQRCMQYLNFMEQNGYCMKDEDNDFGGQIDFIIQQSDEEWALALDMLQNLLQGNEVVVLCFIDNLLDSLLAVNWEKKILICQFIQDVGIHYFRSFSLMKEIFQMNDESMIVIALKRMNQLIKKRKSFNDYEYLLINMLTIKTEEEFLFLEKELAPLFFDSFFHVHMNNDTLNVEKIHNFAKQNPEKWMWIKNFLSSHSLKKEFFSLFEVLCDVKDQKKLDKHFPFLKSIYNNSYILIQEIDELEDIDYESMHQNLSQKHKAALKKLEISNPKLILFMGNLTDQEIESILYFSDKKISFNIIETYNALKTFDLKKMPFFKILIDTLTSFKFDSYKEKLKLNLPYLLSLNIADWGKISEKLINQSKEKTLSDIKLDLMVNLSADDPNPDFNKIMD